MTTQTTTTVQVGDQGDTGRVTPPSVATMSVTDNSKPSAPVTSTVQVGTVGVVLTASQAGPAVPPVATQSVTTNK